ncbi:MAG: hypothetical protein ABJA78_16470 [Ferruginibacter sp.]
MKKQILLSIFILGYQFAFSQRLDWINIEAMGDSIKMLVAESKAGGFEARRGKPIGDGDPGEHRYEVKNPIKCFNTKIQYISVIDSKEYYVFTIKGETNEDAYLASRQFFSDEGKEYNWKWKPGYLILATNSSNSLPENSEWYGHSNFFRDGPNGQLVLWHRYKRHPQSLSTILIGSFVDYGILKDELLAKEVIAKKAKFVADFKPSGDVGLDSIKINYLNFFDRNTDEFRMRLEIEKICSNSNTYYNGTVGNRYPAQEGRDLFYRHDCATNFGYFPKPPDGNEIFYAPKWLDADASFFVNDTTGHGTMLYLFLNKNNERLSTVLKALRILMSRDDVYAFGSGNNKFYMCDRKGDATFRFRFDTAATAGYQGLTVVFEQWWDLAKRIANAKYDRERNESMQRFLNENKNYNSSAPLQPRTCFCCHGLGKVDQLTDKTYQKLDAYGNVIGTTSYRQMTCSCCKGTGYH